MCSKHTINNDRNMKNALRLRIGATVLVGGLLPMGAQAFIDERSKPASPSVEVAETAAALAVEVPAPVAPVAPKAVAVALQAGVTGDVTGKAWQMPYPGPYGVMPLADALIAQVVPVVGKTIELNGSVELLSKKVNVIKGANRIDTLRNMATNEGLGIVIQGNLVSLSGSGAPRLAQAGVHTSQMPAEVVKVTKTWHIDTGSMLSTAMLEWAGQWGWKLIWKADVDYRISAPITLDGDFLENVSTVLDAYRGSDRPLWGDWNEQQRVLVIREPSNRDK